MANDHDNRDDHDRNDHVRDHDHDPGPANDNGGPPWKPPEGQALAPKPAAGALAALNELKAMIRNVDTSTMAGRSNQPLLNFRSREGGIWAYGQRQTVVEEDAQWAINPMTFERGYISFNDLKKVVGERLLSVRLPMPLRTELPDTGFPWTEQWAVNMKCTNGADAGVEVIYKPTTVGGIQAIGAIIGAIDDRINSGECDLVVPVVRLEKDSYVHSQHGRIWIPVLTIVGWLSLSGPPGKRKPEPEMATAPAPRPASPAAAAAEPPRKRRVA
jgi:hypothetical protein